MISAFKQLPGNTVEITVTLSWSEIKTEYDRIFNELLSQIELPGFRKGKAPKDLAGKQIKSTKVYEEVLKKIVPQVYQKILAEQKIQPIISPKVEVLAASENKDWKLRFLTCEQPEIDLGNYKEAVSKLVLSKKPKIWVPGESKDQDKKDEPSISELLEVLSKEIKVGLSELILEQEVNRKLSSLVDQLQKLGMTVEQYLQSNGKTSEILRQEFQEEARKTLSLEFALEEIANQENVTVSNAEIDDFIAQAKNSEEKEMLIKQKYYIASILRRQKTISRLLKPAIIKP